MTLQHRNTRVTITSKPSLDAMIASVERDRERLYARGGRKLSEGVCDLCGRWAELEDGWHCQVCSQTSLAAFARLRYARDDLWAVLRPELTGLLDSIIRTLSRKG